MRFHCLSGDPNRPCNIIQFKNSVIMLDCGLDLRPLQHYLPIPLVSSAKIYNLPSVTANGDVNIETELRESNGRAYLDSEPEVLPPTNEFFNFSDVDVILISNYNYMLALPYITENTGFKGKILCTEPTMLLGKIFMEEMIEYLDRAPRLNKPGKWKQFKQYLPPPLSDIKNVEHLKPLYTKAAVNSCLAKVEVVGHNEKTDCFGLIQVTSVSSGYCIGSCNWLLSTGFEKIVYISASSTLTTHPRAIDQINIKNADCMILTGLTQAPTLMPDPMIGDFCRLVCDTLKSNGNVLIPCFPSGIIYDLFECLAGQMEMNGLTSIPLFFLSPVADSSLAYSNIMAEWLSIAKHNRVYLPEEPLFFLSPVADSSLAYSNIMAEWLSIAKHNRVYLPEEPFVHGNLIRNGRLKSFKNLQDESVNSEYRQPCVVFCGHPSLRFGDAVHFIELWGNNPNNLIIFTEPSVDYLEALAPFQPLEMKAISKPIDTSLNFVQAKKLITDSRPKCLVVPEVYTHPPGGMAPGYPPGAGGPDLYIDVNVPTYKYNKFDIIKLPVERSFENISIDQELAESLVPSEIRPGVALATITGKLVVRDNRYTLMPIKKVKLEQESSSKTKTVRIPLEDQKPGHHMFGKLNTQEFVQKLATLGFRDAKVETGSNGGFPVQIHLPSEDILIQVEEKSSHILYDQPENATPEQTEKLRGKVKQAFLACINKF
eukprot:TRINITY_DN3162_c0_g1_i2.p1 TRINITY_DN3162_c0_g1~~TRINITY_DN3162_c0_g1_i2.p1  ORF type:complete len:711 (+),score=150.28 TRINITY_DN3162_c0_g1_i2:54-2186(+)